jgi:hypothetical protein
VTRTRRGHGRPCGGAALRVHLNRGEGQLEPLDPVGGGLRGVTLADVDLDGLLDIVAIEGDDLHVLLGTGDGRFTPVKSTPSAQKRLRCSRKI